MRATLFQKGLILLFVPLLFEIFVAASLIYLQHYYGEAVKAEALRKQIVYHINEFWYYNLTLTSTTLGAAFIKDFDADWNTTQEASKQYDILSPLLAGDAEQIKRLTGIMNCHLRIGHLCGDLKPVVSNAGGKIGQILAMKSNLLTCKRMMPLELELGVLMRAFREHELVESDKAAERVRFISWQIQFVLVGAIVGSALIASLLFRFFMRGIHRGVRALIENIERFKTGAPLAPAIAGSDEIAQIDARFREMAEEVASAQQMKQAFVTTMSSECRVPINSTREFLARLAAGSDGNLSEKGRDRASKGEQSLDRLLTLINDLLVLQAPGLSRIEIQPRRCSLAGIIQSSIDAVLAFADQHGVRIESQGTELEAYADPDRIVQVLVNLLSNAIKFSPAGSSVIVSARAVDDQVEVSVEDKGRGIPANLKEAVFERFQQVTVTDAIEQGGTGLGLPICKEIVERHGGRIGVESEEGKGSTFWIRLPAGGPAEV